MEGSSILWFDRRQARISHVAEERAILGSASALCFESFGEFGADTALLSQSIGASIYPAHCQSRGSGLDETITLQWMNAETRLLHE